MLNINNEFTFISLIIPKTKIENRKIKKNGKNNKKEINYLLE